MSSEKDPLLIEMQKSCLQTVKAEYEELVHTALKPVEKATEEETSPTEENKQPPIVEAIAARYDELLNHV